MWFKYGLKAQKLLAQGIALGIMAISKAPCKGKSFMFFCLRFLKSFALTGRQVCVRNYPGRCPGLGASRPFRACPNRTPTASDVPPSTSRRIVICVGTQMVARRDAVLGASGAQLLAIWVSWLIGGKAKM